MIRFVLIDENDHKFQAAFAVMNVERKADIPFGGGGGELHEIAVSTGQLQEIVSRLWVLLPLADRPLPRRPNLRDGGSPR